MMQHNDTTSGVPFRGLLAISVVQFILCCVWFATEPSFQSAVALLAVLRRERVERKSDIAL